MPIGAVLASTVTATSGIAEGSVCSTAVGLPIGTGETCHPIVCTIAAKASPDVTLVPCDGYPPVSEHAATGRVDPEEDSQVGTVTIKVDRASTEITAEISKQAPISPNVDHFVVGMDKPSSSEGISFLLDITGIFV